MVSELYPPHISRADFNNIARMYVFLQALIWLKVGIFYLVFGKGIVGDIYFPFRLSAQFFLSGNAAAIPGAFLLLGWPAIFDFFFHQTMHAAIAVVVFNFALRSSKTDLQRLVIPALAGSFLHNAGYWLTGVESSVWEGLADFLVDAAALLFFARLFWYASRTVPMRRVFSILGLERPS